MEDKRQLHQNCLQNANLQLHQAILTSPSSHRFQIQQDPPPTPPAQVPNPVQLLQIQVQQVQPQLNWSYFKPEFSGKPEEDAEGHLLRTNDWMETHNFPEVTKVQRFCLTLTREARLLYESLRHIVIDWTGLQEQFKRQYLTFGGYMRAIIPCMEIISL